MNINGSLGLVLGAAVLTALTGCLPQNTQSQGLQNAQMANDMLDWWY